MLHQPMPIPDKSQASYIRFLQALQTIKPNLRAMLIMVEFERVAINASIQQYMLGSFLIYFFVSGVIIYQPSVGLRPVVLFCQALSRGVGERGTLAWTGGTNQTLAISVFEPPLFRNPDFNLLCPVSLSFSVRFCATLRDPAILPLYRAFVVVLVSCRLLLVERFH